VVDHQSVNILFEDDITVSFTMAAFNRGGRTIHIMGTKGEIHAALVDAENTYIKVYDFETNKEENIQMTGRDGVIGGHGGGDGGIVETLYHYLNDAFQGNSVPSIEESYYNHLLVFAAEQSRHNRCVVDVEEYIKSIK